jgi:hypothetical protein
MTKTIDITYEEISQVLSYEPDTGAITWKVSVNSRAKAGNPAGVWQRMSNGREYFSVTYRGRSMAGGPLAWFLYHKEWPDRSIFYADKNPRNLAISNLRLADHKAVKVVKDDGSVGYKMTQEQVRHYALVQNYGITITEYAQMYSKQNGLCAICGKPETARVPGRKAEGNELRTRDLSVDHNHTTGKNRELLCNACNHMLGHSLESKSTLLNAVRYLLKHDDEKTAASEKLDTAVREAIICLSVEH